MNTGGTTKEVANELPSGAAGRRRACRRAVTRTTAAVLYAQRCSTHSEQSTGQGSTLRERTYQKERDERNGWLGMARRAHLSFQKSCMRIR